jgi:hypothetical protein
VYACVNERVCVCKHFLSIIKDSVHICYHCMFISSHHPHTHTHHYTHLQDYIADVDELYQEMREEYLAGLEDRSYVDLAYARKHALHIDWKDPAVQPKKPNFVGTKVVRCMFACACMCVCVCVCV